MIRSLYFQQVHDRAQSERARQDPARHDRTPAMFVTLIGDARYTVPIDLEKSQEHNHVPNIYCPMHGDPWLSDKQWNG